MKQKTYAEKLLDPRWQKKRLQILNRDKFTCQDCKSTENTLHVHHISYSKGEPLETPNKLLITLCSDCHECETDKLSEFSNDTIHQIKKCGLMADDFLSLVESFWYLEKRDYKHIKLVCDALAYTFQNDELFDIFMNPYLEYRKTWKKPSKKGIFDDLPI